MRHFSLIIAPMHGLSITEFGALLIANKLSQTSPTEDQTSTKEQSDGAKRTGGHGLSSQKELACTIPARRVAR